jgi:hypothetical protein
VNGRYLNRRMLHVSSLSISRQYVLTHNPA